MPLRDEYPRGLEPAGTVEAEGGVYEEALDREAAEDAYRAEVGIQQEVEAIRDSYHAWMKECQVQMGGYMDEEGAYEAAVEAVREQGFDPSPDAVERYCERYAVAAWDGFYISALCNESSHDTFTLPDLSTLSYLGYQNEKDITVEGSVQNAAGMRMQDGTLTVKGDAGDHIGEHLEGGVIELHGAGDIATVDDGTVEDANGMRRYTVPEPGPDGIVQRVRRILEAV